MNQYQYDTKVIQEWVDHNGHMNDAEYNRVLSDATDDWLAHLGLTLETIKTLHYTVFTLENHLTFLKEMKLDEDIGVKVHLYDYDSKRLHVFMEMLNSEQALTSTYEVMLMGIDTENGRPSPFPDSIAHNIEAYYKKDEMTTRPKQLGHQIGITRK